MYFYNCCIKYLTFLLLRISSEEKDEQLSESVVGSKQTPLSNKTKIELLNVLSKSGEYGNPM